MTAKDVGRRVSYGCVAVAAFVLVAHTAGVVLVLGSQIVLGWWISGPLVVVAIAGMLLTRRRLAARDPDPPRAATAALAVSVVVAVLVAAGTGLTVVDEATRAARWTLLPQQSPSGCRVVSRETEFIVDGEGSVFAGTGPLLVRVGRFSTAGAYRPIERGTYTLTWSDGSHGDLTMTGDLPTTVRPSSLPINC